MAIISSFSRAAIWCIFCLLFHSLMKIFGMIFPEFEKLGAKEKNAAYNRGVSSMHATVMFVWTVYYWVIVNPTVAIPDECEDITNWLLDIMMGYLCYDFLFEFTHTRQLDTIGHHVLGMISHISTRFTGSGPAGLYCMLVFVAEGSTPALNLSWLLHQLKMKDTLLFKICAGYLIISFFVCRVLLAPYTLWHLTAYRDSWGVYTNTPMYWGNWFVIACFVLLNFVWFYKLLSVAFGGKKKVKEGAAAAAAQRKDS